MKIGVLSTFHNNYVKVIEKTFPVINNYCKTHDYIFIPHEIKIPETDKELTGIGFHKIQKIYDLFFNEKENYDLLWVIDTDIVVTNPLIKLESFVDEQYNYFVTTDWDGINNGSFLIKNSVWAKKFLEWILSQKNNYRNEQDVLKHNPQSEYWKEIKILPQPSINSFLYSEYPKFGQTHLGNIGCSADWKRIIYYFTCPDFLYKID